MRLYISGQKEAEVLKAALRLLMQENFRTARDIDIKNMAIHILVRISDCEKYQLSKRSKKDYNTKSNESQEVK